MNTNMRAALLLLLLLWAGGVRAGWVENALAFAGGLAAGLVVHELGHVVVARAYGEKLDWNGGLWSANILAKISRPSRLPAI